jgi:hypothetical protein
MSLICSAMMKLQLLLQVQRPSHKPLDAEALANKSPQTPLLQDLQQMIALRGPLSIDDYMREALTHPTHGYYSANVESLGETGDFTTAPEVTTHSGLCASTDP